jgi:hypothetical protein
MVALYRRGKTPDERSGRGYQRTASCQGAVGGRNAPLISGATAAMMLEQYQPITFYEF